ncbi:hypothetical protein GCK72_009486 [Caenorhabditis remanei]|uniref:Uncharacterized protein n=1 Tax=Caenorhabditis remanei TaxID=31234 RepID=A0A6A5H426_CAERE|nr:hypothetical protein GCK72_009486 [Caenorhabditis remanei]KAF1761232.1 hypothetical protein GCK72_009486 [Caenorhabditis remanei]
MRLLILLFAVFSVVSAMGFINFGNGGGGGQVGPPKIKKGDWPARFPQHPAGFDYKCKNRQFGTVTLAPSSGQQVQRDVEEVVTTTTHAPTTTHTPTTTHAPTTTTVKPTSTTTLKQILTTPTTTTKKADPPKATGTTFWIRSPTPPNTPVPVVRGGHAFTLGPPQLATVKIIAPFAPDAALDPFGIPSGDLDFDIKPVGTPKAPRAVIDPDA